MAKGLKTFAYGYAAALVLVGFCLGAADILMPYGAPPWQTQLDVVVFGPFAVLSVVATMTWLVLRALALHTPKATPARAAPAPQGLHPLELAANSPIEAAFDPPVSRAAASN